MPSEQEMADLQRLSNDYVPDVTVGWGLVPSQDKSDILDRGTL